MPATDPHGEVALMLCECLLHLLVEEGVIPQAKAVSAIETVAGTRHDRRRSGRDDLRGAGSAAALVDAIAQRFAAKFLP
jgi:hypothetical protein